MNDLSWLLYLAEVSGNLSIFMGFLAVPFGLASFVMTTCFFVTLEDESIRKLVKPILPWLYVPFLVFSLLAILVPSSKTVYLIASSELAETTLETEVAKRIGAKIEAALDQFIEVE